MAKSSFFKISPSSKRKICPDPDISIAIDNNNRTRADSLEERTINNTNIFNFDGKLYNAKIVDVNETNIIQIIFKFNNTYNRWKCKLNFNSSINYDEKLTHIYLKSFINTVQIVKCFFLINKIIY